MVTVHVAIADDLARVRGGTRPGNDAAAKGIAYVALDNPEQPSNRNGMRPYRRATAIMAQLLVLQFLALGSGVVCPIHGMHGATAMMSMDLSGAHRGPHSVTPESPSSSQDPGTPCSIPWAPSGCPAGLPCSPAAIATPPLVLPSPIRVTAAPLRPTIHPPPSRSTPPDLPPPRA